MTIRSAQPGGSIRIRTPGRASIFRYTHILIVALQTAEDANVQNITKLADPGGRAM